MKRLWWRLRSWWRRFGTEAHVCPLSVGHPAGGLRDTRWEKRGRDRVCDFCGSLHPDEFLALLSTVDGVATTLELNDRRDKIYIRRPDVRNADDGALKIKTAHLEKYTEAQHDSVRSKLELCSKVRWGKK